MSKTDNSLCVALKGKNIILASSSPRRREFFAALDIPFSVKSPDVDESYPSTLHGADVVEYISRVKARAISLNENDIVISADTIVCVDDIILGKPKDADDAIEMITLLSGKTHQVITGVTIRSCEKEMTFSQKTEVTLATLDKKDIAFYVEKYAPMDKAGAYAIQEWIGEIGITNINGSYHNVVGMPMAQVYSALKDFVK
ncbi:MAG: Maf family nucleotide pyrophosphatase [Flavobacteriales bacterium]|nr:Maf family nucleotide pyrophosphatase [Flavobacteriales bacterium]